MKKMLLIFDLIYYSLLGSQVLGIRFNIKTWYPTEIYQSDLIASDELTVDSKTQCTAIATSSVNDSINLYCYLNGQCMLSSQVVARKTVAFPTNPYYTCKTLFQCNTFLLFSNFVTRSKKIIFCRLG